MPGSSGPDVLAELNAAIYPAPILVLCGRSDISGAIAAIRNGAFDFIDKPLDADTIVTRVREAIERWERRRNIDYLFDIALPSLPGYDLLTTREREVLFQITTAASVKETGINLGISPRTVAVHRRQIMRKLGAGNSATLIRVVLTKVRSMQV
jgi:FixJ family two-component response regulator